MNLVVSESDDLPAITRKILEVINDCVDNKIYTFNIPFTGYNEVDNNMFLAIDCIALIVKYMTAQANEKHDGMIIVLGGG